MNFFSLQQGLSVRTSLSRRVLSGALFCVLLFQCSLYAQLTINEFVASNVEGILDEDGDSSDWLEFKNTSGAPVDTLGFSISDDEDNLRRWNLPSVVIPAGGYLLVWCSGKDRDGSGGDPDPEPNTGAVSHWPLAEGAGEIFENLIDGELDGFLDGTSVQWVDVLPDASEEVPPQDSAIRFSGSNSRISTNFEGVSGSQARTVSFWIRTTSTTTHGLVAWGNSGSNGAKYHIRLNTTAANGAVGALRTEVQGGQNVATTVINDGRWHHVASVFPVGGSGVSDVIHYVDGELDPRSGGGDFPINTSGGITFPVTIGSRQQGGSFNDFDGDIADVRIYDREIDLDGIRTILEGGEPPPGEPPPPKIEGMHSNFNLSSGGEELFLVSPDGEIVDSIDFPRQVSDQSYGRSPDGIGGFRYHLTPTPLAENSGVVSQIPLVVADTKFEPNRGFYSDPFEVSITTVTPDATIRYTFDGTLPTETHGFIYNGPIPVSDTTVIRAIAYKDGLRSTNADAHSYIFLDTPAGGGVLNQPSNPPGWPSTWGSRTADYEMDQRVVSDDNSPYYDENVREGLLGHPSISISIPLVDMFDPSIGIYSNSQAHGDQWERACSFEILHPSGERGVQVNAGLRIMGNASRSPSRPKHNMRVAFRRSYGPSKLDYPVFSDSPVEEFDTIVLRGGNGDSWFHPSATQRLKAQYIRDQWHRDVEKAMGNPTTHQAYYHLYINGLYWGLYHVFERPNAEFLSSHFGGEEEEWDAMNGGDPIDGDLVAYNQLLSIARGGMSSPQAYANIQEYLNVANMADHLIINFHSGNVDWDTKNWYGGRRRAPGAGYMFFCWDAERTFWNVNENRTNLDISGKPSSIHQDLRANAEYRVLFGDRVHRHLFNDGVLTEENGAAFWQARADEIIKDLAAESARWGDDDRAAPYSVDTEWQAELNLILNTWFPQRTNVVLNQFRSQGLYSSLEAPTYNQHGGRVEKGFRLTIQAPLGAIYYTLNGEDPRLSGGEISPDALSVGGGQQTELLSEDAPIRYRVPVDASEDDSWMTSSFVDSQWAEGVNGVGFERNAGYEDIIQTDTEADMYNTNASVYMRMRFNVDDPSIFSTLTLGMKYDDGFVAYLNGHPIARRNDPSPVQWNSSATAGHGDTLAQVFESIDVTEHLDRLEEGENVLAVHGMNVTQGSSDCLFVAVLNAVEAGEDNSIFIEETTRVQARTYQGGQWSALNEAVFVHFPLRVTEVHYHPAPPAVGSPFDPEDFEFIEFKNTGPDRLDLEGIRLEGDIQFDFSTGSITSLAPGEVLVLVEDTDAFEQRYGLFGRNVAGQYRGNLSNGGGDIRIVGTFGEHIQNFTTSDTWHPETDGLGPSLVIIDPSRDPETWNLGESWEPSELTHGTPGDLESGSGGIRLPGDANLDAHLDLGDGIRLMLLLFTGEPLPIPCEGDLSSEGNVFLLDANGDEVVDSSDSVYLLNYIFLDGPPHQSGERCRPIEGCEDLCE